MGDGTNEITGEGISCMRPMGKPPSTVAVFWLTYPGRRGLQHVAYTSQTAALAASDQLAKSGRAPRPIVEQEVPAEDVVGKTASGKVKWAPGRRPRT
jgi:hypothetical protein